MNSIMKVMYKQGFALSTALVVVISILLLFPSCNSTQEASPYGKDYVFGIDVSKYQGEIDWSQVGTHHPIEFVFTRATMGSNGKDAFFTRNWKGAQEEGFIRGAYHYYRPNENSTQQFENFASVVKLESGDLVPVLDIETESDYGRDNLRQGVLNWLLLAEEEYGVKPIIYTGLNFYKHVLQGYVDDYPLWIAAYSGGKARVKNIPWTFHQFSDNVRVNGIIENRVDGNDFYGSLSELDSFRIR